MLAGVYQDTAKIYQGFTIQLQGFYCCPSDASQSQDLGSIVRPSEVVRPTVPARMKQYDIFIGNRIASLRSIVLVIVASLARQRQVARRPSALAAVRSNVLQGEALMSECSRATAVFAPSLCAP